MVTMGGSSLWQWRARRPYGNGLFCLYGNRRAERLYGGTGPFIYMVTLGCFVSMATEGPSVSILTLGGSSLYNTGRFISMVTLGGSSLWQHWAVRLYGNRRAERPYGNRGAERSLTWRFLFSLTPRRISLR